MEAYCAERKLGISLAEPPAPASKSIELAVAVLQYRPAIAEDESGMTWRMSDRDVNTEIVVPTSVLQDLGPDIYAGLLVGVSSSADPSVTHVARIIPVDLCEYRLLSDTAAAAFDIDDSTCLTGKGKPLALLSPVLAFNLGLTYQLIHLMEEPHRTLFRDDNMITLTTIPTDFPCEAENVRMSKMWTPGEASQRLQAATNVGLAFFNDAEKPPPFNIVEFQDNLAAATQMQGAAAERQAAEDKKEEEAGEELIAEHQKQKDTERMQALQEFMSTPRLVCLGDVIPLTVKSTPMIGPPMVDPKKHRQQKTSIVFLKVVELSADVGTLTKHQDAPQHAMLWQRSTGVDVGIIAVAASAYPIGAEQFLLDIPPERGAVPPPEPDAGPSTSTPMPPPPAPPPPLSIARLGRNAYANLYPYQELCRGTLLATPVWREIASLFMPLVHGTSKPTAAGPEPRAGAQGTYVNPAAEAAARTGGGISTRVAVLLKGPERCGKNTEVEAAGAALGVHVMELDCRTLSGSPMDEAECVVHLQDAIQQARSAAPVILHLRHLQRIFHDQANPAIVSRFADELTAANAAYADPFLPEIAPLPESGAESPEEPPPLLDLPWCALNGPHRPDGTRVTLTQGHTVPYLSAIHKRHVPGTVLIVGSTSKIHDIPTPLRRFFTAEVAVPPPSEERRASLLQYMLAQTCGMSAEELRAVAQTTSGFQPVELGSAACDAILDVMYELIQADPECTEQFTDEELGGKVGKVEMDKALEDVRKRMASDLGAPKIPNIKWDDVGGLEHVKQAILETIELPMKHPEFFRGGVKRRSGVLLYGPPGTGKTLIAKAVASECKVNFISVKGPELVNMYVGESEKNVRDVFEKARKSKPCIIFFDELDSLAPARGNSGDSGPVSDRIVAQMLTELDGIGGGESDVYIIGATNRPDLLDSALMRPGRLDVLLYVGVDRSPASKLKVLTALTRKFKMEDDVDLDAIAAGIPETSTGADMYGLCADAWMNACKRKIAELEAAGRVGKDGDRSKDDFANEVIVVAMEDFIESAENMTPSLSVKDLEDFDKLEEQYKPTKKKAAMGGFADVEPSEQGPKIKVVEEKASASASVAGAGTMKLPARRKKAPVATLELLPDEPQAEQ